MPVNDLPQRDREFQRLFGGEGYLAERKLKCELADEQAEKSNGWGRFMDSIIVLIYLVGKGLSYLGLLLAIALVAIIFAR